MPDVPTSAFNGYLYLVDDAGDGRYASGPPILLSPGGTLQNSQCTINAAGSSASASRDTLNPNLAITYTPSFAVIWPHGTAPPGTQAGRRGDL
ncbi:MAG TPA: hypothetical protein VGG72_17415 [Bryobacteraceae bacterium]|jgi:hypothetical protein